MRGGIQHRDAQTCAHCRRIFFWSPGLNLCPYCDLSQNARQTGPYDGGEPCPPNCCTERTA